jgi:hypothetical protein
LLTEADAQKIAEKLLLAKYYESKINFSGCQLITTDDSQAYQLRGELIMRSRSWLDHFTGPKSANIYSFTVKIDAQQGQIVNYEIV